MNNADASIPIRGATSTHIWSTAAETVATPDRLFGRILERRFRGHGGRRWAVGERTPPGRTSPTSQPPGWNRAAFLRVGGQRGGEWAGATREPSNTWNVRTVVVYLVGWATGCGGLGC